MNAALTPPSPAPARRPAHPEAVLASLLGAFMAVLGIAITNSSL